MAVNQDRIVSIVYNNGIEIIAELLEADDEHILMRMPFRIVQIQHQGQVGLSFAPAFISADENGMIASPISSLMFLPIEAKSEFKQKYLELTTGIVLPPQSIITG